MTAISRLQLPATTTWGLRGGDTTASSADDDNAFYTAVGLQVVGACDDQKTLQQGSESKSSSSWLVDQAVGSNFMLLKGDDTHPQLLPQSADSSSSSDNNHNHRIWDGDTAAVESLAIGCDVMVVVVVVDHQQQPQKPLLDINFVQALTRGLQQRAAKDMASSVLILLVTKDNNSPKITPSSSKSSLILTSEKDRLVLQELSELTPATVTSLDLLSLDDPTESTEGLATVWKEILRDASSQPEKTTSHLVEANGFSQLLQGIYRSKEGTSPSNKFVSSLATQLEKKDLAVTEKEKDDNGDTSSFSVTTTTSSRMNNNNPTSSSDDEQESMLAILNLAQSQIRDLERQQEQLWLGYSDDTDIDAPPRTPADFGANADLIIGTYQAAIAEEHLEDETSQAQAQRNLWQYILPPLKQLYDQQLQFLREQYGKQYEQALEDSTTTTTTTRSSRSSEDYQEAWKDAAAQATTSFREAAQAAIPTQCRLGQALRDANFDYVPALEGLLSDMMLATEDQQVFLGISPEDEDDEDDSVGQGGKRPAKWYEKVAAKAFVFAVNYCQGWLAYQGIKHAAAQRDAHLPKFPLF